MLDNPFEFGRELAPEELVDREEELRQVTDVLMGARKLFLIGPRRYGKTSVLRAASDRAEGKGATVLRYDAEAFPTLEQLAERLLADTAARLTRTVEKAGAVIKEFFASVRPSATFDPVENRWSVTFAGTEARSGGAPLLADVLNGVERAAARADHPTAVVIDEFQKVIEQGGADAEGQIRSAIQRHRHVGYVFAGSKTRLLADMTANPQRPFYKLGDVCFLGPVPRDDFAEFLRRGFAKGGIAVEADAIEAILDLAEEVPYNVQLLAHACWQACWAAGAGSRGSNKPAALTSDLVRRTRDSAALRADPIYTQLWSSLTSSQQRALLALLREGSTGLTSTAVAQRYRMPISTMQRALELLDNKGIIREEQARGSVRLRLSDPLFGAWIGLVIPR